MTCEDFLAGLTGVNPLTATAGFRAAMFRHMRTCTACIRALDEVTDRPLTEEEEARMAAEEGQMRRIAASDYADEEFLKTVLGDDYEPG